MTPLQKAFAELVGTLLGRRWFEEQRLRADQQAAVGNAREENQNSKKEDATRKKMPDNALFYDADE